MKGAVSRMQRLEARLARGAVALLRALGPATASNLAGGVARAIGPLLPLSRIADINLRLAMPELDAAARRRIIRGVWENLGRTVGELPHLGRLPEGRLPGPSWFVDGMEHIDALLAQGGAAILISAHMGNWELQPAAARQHGLDFGVFYRAADNEAVDELINHLRQAAATRRPLKLFPKGSAGARAALMHMKRGGILGMLVDQKMNDGIEARFFGRPAMTPSAAAVLALRLRCPVMPVHVRRLGPARLSVVCEAPLPLPDSGDRAADVLALTQAMNDRLETWIRARPESWLWLHRRWGKELYRR